MAKAAVISKGLRDKLGGMLSAARRGELVWLAELVEAAGFVNPDVGVQQRAVLEAIPQCTRSVLSAWEKDGLPAVRRGKGKFYPVLALLAWMYDRFVGPGRPVAAGAGEKGQLLEYLTEDTRWKAANRKLRYERETGELILRSEADRQMVGLILEVKASLLGLPANLAPQLENQSTPAIRRAIASYVHWMCTEMQRGRVPVPSAVGGAIEKLIRRAVGPDEAEEGEKRPPSAATRKGAKGRDTARPRGGKGAKKKAGVKRPVKKRRRK